MDEIQRDEGLLYAYHMYEMSLSDETSRLNYALEKGLAKGVERGQKQGLAKGLEEGRKEAYQEKLETARRFKAMGLPNEQIASGTGLSLEEIATLN
jgi:predicted transposase/invertase (TIGR01784 family)